MALQLNDLLMRLQPPSAQSMGMGDDKSIERQHLALMREQFEETKRRNVEDEQLRQMAEAGAMQRAELLAQKEREQAAAQAAAESLKVRQGALADFMKYQDTGDFEGMDVAATRLNALGGFARRLDAGGGFPSWQVGLEAPKAPRGLNPLDSLGYDSLAANDSLSETRPEAAAPLSTEEAFARAGSVPTDQAPAPTGGDPTTDAPDALTSPNTVPGGEASADYGPPTAEQAQAGTGAPAAPPEIQGLTPGMTHFAPRRAPDAPDAMGGVPRDVIDTGALQAQRQQRLGPVMANIERSMPAAYRASTEANDQAAAGMGLPADKALEASLKLRAPADAAIDKERGQEFKTQEADAKIAAQEKDPIKRARRMDYGEKYAKQTYDEEKIQTRIAILDASSDIESVLQDSDHFDDQKAINLLMKLNAQVGAQSDADAERMTGEGKASVVDRIKNWLSTAVTGGFSDPLKKSMLDYAHRLGERQQGALHDHIERMYNSADRQQDPLAGTGIRDFVERTMPSAVLQSYDKEAGDGEPAAGAAAPAASHRDDHDFMETLDAEAADKNLDPDKMLAIMGPESHGQGDAKNPHSSASGIIQMLDSVARGYINPRTGKHFDSAAELRELAPAEQAPIMAQYFHDKGVDEDSPVEDYALAVAAPKYVGKSANRDQVVYPKGSDAYEANKPWQPADGGDITIGSILDFYLHTKGKKSEPAKSIALLDVKDEKPAPTAAQPAAPSKGKGKDDAKLLEGL